LVRVKTGLENLIGHSPEYLKKKRLGLLANPASVDFDFTHARTLVDRTFKDQLTTLFSPQHGFFADKQDNMIESDHSMDSHLNIPVYSLYGETRKPLEHMFENIDVLLVDLQDVGTRVYTFMYTVSYCMEAAKNFGKKIVILDRPNPVGGIKTEGNVLNEEFRSFVGRYPIPMRHGLTMGELARLFNDHFGIGCDLDIIPLTGWNRGMYYHETGLSWVAPSPNLPVPVSAYVYPGQVIFEGAIISEGRGTTQPFELVGAPYANPETMLTRMNPVHLKGIHLRPVAFEPTSNKWQGQTCKGFQIHIKNLEDYEPYITSLALLQAFIAEGGDAFAWKEPPYEYEFEKKPIDLILGDSQLRQRLTAMENLTDIMAHYHDGLARYNRIKQSFHLYR
jgi:uncharacterized protein YbbC (DUF1343 family)